LQPYDVLKHDLLLLSKDAVMRLSHSLDPEKKPVVVPDVESIAPAAKPVKKEAAPKAATKKPACERKREAGKEKGEGISDVNPSLSDYPAADHHGKKAWA